MSAPPCVPPTMHAKKRPPCPVCGKESVTEYRPFCSARCADVDLGRWLGGAYAIPTNETPPDLPPDED